MVRTMVLFGVEVPSMFINESLFSINSKVRGLLRSFAIIVPSSVAVTLIHTSLVKLKLVGAIVMAVKEM